MPEKSGYRPTERPLKSAGNAKNCRPGDILCGSVLKRGPYDVILYGKRAPGGYARRERAFRASRALSDETENRGREK